MRCVAVDGAGAVVDVSPQPVDTSTCVLVLASPTELTSPWAQLFALTADEGASIATAIALCWVIGWIVRQGVRIGGYKHD